MIGTSYKIDFSFFSSRIVFLSEVESRTQSWRPRTDPLDAKAKDRGHRHKCSPKKSPQNFFSGDLKKRGLQKFFQAKKVFKIFFSGDLYLRKPKKRSLQIFRKVSGVFQRHFNGSKIVLSSSRGQGNFRGLEASMPRPRTSKCVLEAKDVLEDSNSDFCG